MTELHLTKKNGLKMLNKLKNNKIVDNIKCYVIDNDNLYNGIIQNQQGGYFNVKYNNKDSNIKYSKLCINGSHKNCGFKCMYGGSKDSQKALIDKINSIEIKEEPMNEELQKIMDMCL